MRFAIYARKSTESVDRQIQSLDDQIRELRNLASRENYTVVEIFQESRSAKAPGNRPEFDRMLSCIEAGGLDGVLTWAMDRLSRNPVDGGRIAYLLQTGRLSMIRTIEKSYLPDDNALLLSIENGMSTAYIQNLSRNVKRGMQGKFERGWQNNKAPIGYRNDAETREITPDPDRFDVMREGWNLLLTGDYRLRDVIEHLHSKGLTVHSRNGPRNIVSATALYNAFRNPFYSGQIGFNELKKMGKHLPMVSPDEFERVQMLLSDQGRPTRKRRLSFPFQGTLRCALCGCAILGERKVRTYPRTKRTVEYVYYHCSGSRGCSKASMRQEDIVTACTALAVSTAISERFESWLRKTCAAIIEQRFQVVAPNPDYLAMLSKERKRLDALVTMRADGEIGPEEFARSRDHIQDRIKQLQSEERTAKQTPTILLDKMTTVLDAMGQSRLARKATVEACAAMIRAIGGGQFQPDGLTFNLHPAIQKIATLEPQFLRSEIGESGDVPSIKSNWWTKVNEVLNLLESDSHADQPMSVTSQSTGLLGRNHHPVI